jgi:hypothetical protein
MGNAFFLVMNTTLQKYGCYGIQLLLIERTQMFS